jgi:hypothetical protein
LTLLFKKEYIPLIKNGSKTATRRLSRPMVRVGGTYRVRVDFFSYLPERIRVSRIYRQRLGDMTEDDASREGFASLGEFREEWAGLYGSWDDEQAVWVVEFEHLTEDRNP